MFSDLVTTHMLVAAVTIVYAHVLSDMDPDMPSNNLEVAESALLSILYRLLNFILHLLDHPLYCRYTSPRFWKLYHIRCW